jgi:hypothetical protein
VKVARVSLVAAVLIAFACAPRFHIRTDFDKTVDFSKYRRVTVKSGHSSGDPVMDRRIVDDITQALQSKRYQLVPEGEADAVVVEHAATHEKHTYEAFYEGWNGWGWRWGWGAPVVEEYDFTVGTLIVDMFDARTKQAVWHGSARGVVSGDAEKDAQAIQKAIIQLFERLPAPLLAQPS